MSGITPGMLPWQALPGVVESKGRPGSVRDQPLLSEPSGQRG